MLNCKRKKMRSILIFFRLSRTKQDYKQSSTSKHCHGNFEKVENGFVTIKFFTLGDAKGIETNRFFRDSAELSKFKHKVLD